MGWIGPRKNRRAVAGLAAGPALLAPNLTLIGAMLNRSARAMSQKSGAGAMGPMAGRTPNWQPAVSYFLGATGGKSFRESPAA